MIYIGLYKVSGQQTCPLYIVISHFVVWCRTSACKGAPGSRYQSILTSPTPPNHSQRTTSVSPVRKRTLNVLRVATTRSLRTQVPLCLVTCVYFLFAFCFFICVLSFYLPFQLYSSLFSFWNLCFLFFLICFLFFICVFLFLICVFFLVCVWPFWATAG